ncbi:MAG: class I SAM-dependent methyltransferase [Phycisphaerales bacterium]|nr:class I SAM-dependent methyltransferase [Phycisphaerales bacterium]
MTPDQRAAAARYYDLQAFPNDVPFYESLIPSPAASVLELGCGTGRVLIPLAHRCSLIQGIEPSSAMLGVCRAKLAAAGLPADRARVDDGDAADFDLGRTFDLITAPFRVFQLLETDAQVAGLMRCVRSHLAPGGTCILSMFMPNQTREDMPTKWLRDDEMIQWEREMEGDRIVCSATQRHLDPETLVLYPELVYRRYRGKTLVEEVIQPIVMRCWYPDQIRDLVTGHGFHIIETWGGYDGEPFGEGPELLIQFGLST